MALNLPKWYLETCPSIAPRPFIKLMLTLGRRLRDNSHLLQPPVNNYCVYHPSSPSTSGVTVMVVGGPNARTDYHINTTPEFFYQHRGSMLLKTVDTSTMPHKFVDLPIHENSLYLLPANTPHNPVRFADTVGVVLEQPRPEGSIDRLRWYCQKCGDVVCEKSFHCTDLGTQIKDGVQAFEGDQAARTCGNCGTVAKARPDEGEIEQPPRFPPD